MTIEIDTSYFDDIHFDHEKHLYTLNDVDLFSTTGLVYSFAPEFDEQKVSAFVSKKKGISQEQVLANWDFARKKGTRLHQYVEDKLNGVDDSILASVNIRMPEMDAFDKGWDLLKTNEQAEPVFAELIIGDADLGVGGMIDSIISVIHGLAIFDWKTGKYQTSNDYGALFPPFDDLPDCKHVTYSLQMSVYRYIFEKRTRQDLLDSYLLHLDDKGYHHLYRSMDLRDRIEPWFDGRTARQMCGDASLEERAVALIEALDFWSPDDIGILLDDTKKSLTKQIVKFGKSLK